MKHPVLAGVAVVAAVALIVRGNNVFAVLIACGAAYFIFLAGLTMLGGLSQPVPEPPPAGELRKVKIMYRCSICGAEVRMTIAPDEEPQPPRHCLEDMDLVAPVE